MQNQAILQSITEGNTLKGYQEEVRQLLAKKPWLIVILDDDPTGTQTVKNIPVVTQWSEAVLDNEIKNSNVFFILTNSRSLQEQEARELSFVLGERLQKLAKKYGKSLLVISRGDSTLRGHYPKEVDALAFGMGIPEAKHILAPAFFEGGRYTFQDMHYVREENHFVPAAETPFAKDSTFGYTSSNLKGYILEKYQNEVDPNAITSISVPTLRHSSIEHINGILNAPERSYFIVNATAPVDLEKLALAVLQSDYPFLFRTAASFVNAIIGQRPAPLLTKKELLPNKTQHGSLTVVGSYVPKTTAQLNYLKSRYNADYVELNVHELFQDTDIEGTLGKIAGQLDDLITNGTNVVLFTSRKLKKGSSKEESLAIVNLVSNALTGIVSNITVKPRFILAKGGITSSDIAVKSLQISRAMVLGQVAKGVPVWQADGDSKFPGLPYIVFPGNVGDDGALFTVLNSME